MNGCIRKPALGLCLGLTLASLAGCVAEYRELVDTCWPERYNYVARKTVRDTFNQQAWNGHAFDQTVWTEYFERGTAKLNDAGKERLKYLAHRRPCPDPLVFVQKVCEGKLDEDRVKSVRDELARLSECLNVAAVWDVQARLMPETCLLPTRGAPNLYVTPASARTNLAVLPGAQPGTIPATQPQQQNVQPVYPQPQPIEQPQSSVPAQP